jgi:hypothetical protein
MVSLHYLLKFLNKLVKNSMILLTIASSADTRFSSPSIGLSLRYSLSIASVPSGVYSIYNPRHPARLTDSMC